MKIEKIAFEQLYPTGIYANQRYRAEASVDWEKDDIIECYKTLQSAVEKAFIALNPQIKWDSMPPYGAPIHYDENNRAIEALPAKDSKESATERMLSAINSCTELKVLETFKLLVKNNPVFQEAYNKKSNELAIN